jgi:hypothetical protein
MLMMHNEIDHQLILMEMEELKDDLSDDPNILILVV